MNERARKLAGFVVAIVVVQAIFVGVWFTGQRGEGESIEKRVVGVSSQTELDFDAPRLDFAGVERENQRLADYQGRPIVLHFWGTWCPPCVEELPRLLEWSREDDIVLIAVAIDDDAASLRGFFDSEMPEHVVLVEEVVPGRLAVERLPMTFFVDETGRVLRRWTGTRDWTPAERSSFVEPRSRAGD